MAAVQPTILIAEDDDGHALLIQENLEEAGVSNDILRFADGQEVWDFLTGDGPPPHRDPSKLYVLLLDIRMPKLDGVEVLRRIKAHDDLHTMSVIMLTTTDDPREIAQCYELGCNSYVAKPVDFSAFAEVLKRIGMFISVIAVADPNEVEQLKK